MMIYVEKGGKKAVFSEIVKWYLSNKYNKYNKNNKKDSVDTNPSVPSFHHSLSSYSLPIRNMRVISCHMLVGISVLTRP